MIEWISSSKTYLVKVQIRSCVTNANYFFAWSRVAKLVTTPLHAIEAIAFHVILEDMCRSKAAILLLNTARLCQTIIKTG